MGEIWFITGTDTGVGKTVFTVCLTRHLRSLGVAVRAVKPLCSGGREDAVLLREAQAGDIPLDDLNPWHFKKPIAPVLAARQERRRVSKDAVIDFLRQSARKCDLLLVEGAGGLLSPLGEDYSNRELITGVRARPWIVCPDRLGAVGQARLVLSALPPAIERRAQVVLVGQKPADPAARWNAALLGEAIGGDRVHTMPHQLWPIAGAGSKVRPPRLNFIDPFVRRP
jgi:dethiobiotin synthetase